MTVVDYIDLDDDECYVKDFVDLSTDEDSVENYGNVEEDDKVASSENVAKAAVSSLISEQDATPATSLSKLEQEQPATASLSMLEHGATTSAVLEEETVQPEHQEFLATSDVSKESTRFGNHGLIAVGDFVAEAMQSEHEAEASVFSSMTEQNGATSLLLTKQGAISSAFREGRAIQSGNQVFVASVYCAEEATQSENTAMATGPPSMTEIGSTYKSHRVEQLCQMIGCPHIVDDAVNAMGSTGIYNHQAHEEPEGDTDKHENCDFEAEPEALYQEVSQDAFAMSLSPQDKEKETSRFRKFYNRKGKKQVNTSATECNRQLSIVDTKGVPPMLHNGDSGFSVMGNVCNGAASIGMYIIDCEAVVPTYQGCRKTSQGNTTMYGKARDSGSMGCMVEGCTHGAHGGTPLCIFHNSRPRRKRCCTVIGCTKAARSQGRTDRCMKHGGGKRCKHDGCGKGAIGKTDYCSAHGGGRRCKFQGCRKGALGRTYCMKHGGGKRCKFLGCSASAKCGQDLCSMHITCMLSGNNSSHEMLPAPPRQAKKAESSKRRNSRTIIGGRSRKRQNTNDYVNTRSFNVFETGEERGRVFIWQNNMPKTQQTTGRMNSESPRVASQQGLHPCHHQYCAHALMAEDGGLQLISSCLQPVKMVEAISSPW